MRIDRRLITAWVFVLACTSVAATEDSGAIHGTIVLDDGVQVSGAIHWGRNAEFWNQAFQGVYDEPLRTGERTESVEILGLKLWSWKEQDYLQLTLNVPFGLIETIRPEGDRACELTLTGGETVRIRGSRRFAGGSAEVVVTDADGKRRELRWRSIERVTFSPVAEDPRPGKRLYGTVKSTVGTFTGFVAWDRDEVMLDEILDGDDVELAFSEIAEIHRDGHGGARVIRRNGDEIRMSGTNDVNDDNRGIEVIVDATGVVTVAWDGFEWFRLEAPPASPPRDSFAHAPIVGTVTTRAGEAHSGTILWGDHERFAWETVDAELSRDVDVAVPFAALAAVERESESDAVLVFPDGRRLRVEGDDVDSGERPIEIRSDARTVRVDWEDVRSVRFDHAR